MPEVWLFVPKSTFSGRISALRAHVLNQARERGWAVQQKPVVVEREAGRVSQEDANLVYRRAHTERIAVLCLQEPGQAGTCCVSRPDPVPKASQRWISLRCLLRNKAFFRRLRTDRDHQSWTSAFDAWCSRIECEGVHDPRVLPLHIFNAHVRWSRQIALAPGRSAFDAQFGTGGAGRIDDRRFLWKPADPHARHMGGGSIAGCKLPDGFHWDVQANGSVREICTLTQVWMVRTYLNVAPNGHAIGKEPAAKKRY